MVKSHLFHERTRSWPNISKSALRASALKTFNCRCIYAVHSKSNRADKIGSLFDNVSEAQGVSCTRNCARITTFLLAGRERDADREKLAFSSHKSIVF